VVYFDFGAVNVGGKLDELFVRAVR